MNLQTPPRTEQQQARSQRPARIGELLINYDLLTAKQLDEVLAYQKNNEPDKLLGRIIIEQGYVSAEDFAGALASSFGIPFAQLTEAMAHPDAVQTLPRQFLEHHNILPLSRMGNWLTVAVEDFTDVFLVEEIARLANMQVQVIAATGDNIRQVRQSILADEGAGDAGGQEQEGFGEILNQISVDELTLVEDENDDDDFAVLESAASDSPVIKLVNYIIQSAVQARTSDVHIEPEDGEVRVRFRIDGELHEQMRPPHRLLPAVVSRIKIMAGMDIAERRVPQDGGITVIVGENSVDLRVSTMPTRYGEKVVIRIIDNSTGILSLDRIGFEPAMLASYREALKQKHGIFLVTGPTGSGKSTTLYGTLNEIADDRRNISTIEDPIEYNMKGINQFMVNPKADFTFASALRSLLRQDPDVIMVGEIRDVETAKLAAEAALTGHLVLSTLHTNDAASAVTRLVNMGVEPYLVAASLRGVIGQRLVRRICPHCKQEVEIDAGTRTILERIDPTQPTPDHAWVGAGCARCRHTGCSGRIGIYELLLVDEEMLASIAQSASLQTLRRWARERGFRTMLHDGLDKVRRGLVSIQSLFEVVAYTDEAGPAHAAADPEPGPTETEEPAIQPPDAESANEQ